MKHSIVSFILWLLFLANGMAYASGDYRERMYVQTDKQVYLAGELLWMKLYLTDAGGVPSGFSKVAYVELQDGATTQARAKIEMADGTGEGWLELPSMLPTGYYRLIAYTRYMRNEGDTVYFRKNLAVINTFRKDETIPTDTLTRAIDQETGPQTVSVSTDRAVFTRRMEGEVRIQGLPADALTLGISIAGKEFVPVPDGMTIGRWHSGLPALAGIPLKDEFVPEYEGHLISGKIVNVRTGEPLSGEGVNPLLGFVGDAIRVFGGQRQEDKESVLFYTKRITGVHEAATATYSASDEVYRVDIQSPFAIHPAVRMPVFKMNTAWRDLLEQRNIGLQVIRTFMADSLGHVEPAHPHFMGIPTKSYLLDEYRRFPTMGETVFEFVESVSFRNAGGKRSLFVLLDDLSNQQQSLYGALVLLDGIPIMDHGQIYDYNPALIRRIDVYRRRFNFGGQLFEGIVSFSSYKNNYPTLKARSSTQLFDYEGTQSHRLFYAPSYANESERKSRLPDYRHTLLWLPDVRTEGQTSLTIPFSASDLPGEYQVTVEGITQDGQTIRGVAYISVSE